MCTCELKTVVLGLVEGKLPCCESVVVCLC